MSSYSLSHLSDDSLLRALSKLVEQDRSNTACLLAHMAEVDARKLYLPAGYPSMFAYCIDELRLSEDAAHKRIRVARLAREYPRIFAAIAEGQLHLSTIVQLGIYLTPERADELLSSAAGKSRAQIDELLARRFPRSESFPVIETPVAGSLPAPGPVGAPRLERTSHHMTPIASQRFTVQVTIGQETKDLLDRAQDLLGHSVPNGDMATVLARVVRLGVEVLEKRKFAATDRPRASRASNHPRYTPARVKREVWHRDGGQCTYVSESGHRCAERKSLEFDHTVPAARGGRATRENLRLRCQAHNQYEADRVYGAEFMEGKRNEARERAERVKARESVEEVIPWMRGLGLRAKDARRAAELCKSIPEASLEERVKRALSGWVPRGTVRIPAFGVRTP